MGIRRTGKVVASHFFGMRARRLGRSLLMAEEGTLAIAFDYSRYDPSFRRREQEEGQRGAKKEVDTFV